MMKLIKTELESQPLIETLDNESVVIAQKNGDISVVCLRSNKLLTLKLDEQAVQIEIYKSNIYVSTFSFN